MLALILCSILSATIIGKVVSVHDGDTITVLQDSTQIKVRLAEIDAPELKQAFGQRARQALGEKVQGKEVRVEWKSKDKYGRIVGTIFILTDGKLVFGDSVNLWLVRNGWAWRYDRYSKSDILRAAQDEAKKERKGLWADERAIEPWEWRRAKSKIRVQAR